MLEKEPALSLDVDGSQEDDLLLGFTYANRGGETVLLGEDEQDYLVQKILRDFDRFDNQKSSVKRTWKDVERIVKGIVSDIDKDRFYALVPFGKQSIQTLVSHFWGRSLQTPKLFFSVEGLDQESKDLAPKHRENLLLHLEKDRVRQKMDKAIYLHGLMKGVMIAHIGTCTKKQDIHGPARFLKKMSGVSLSNEVGDSEIVDTQQTIYDGATLTVIDPYDFVFDTENQENWDSCFKAVRKWMIYEDIEADPNFSNYEELKDLSAQQGDKRSKAPLKRKKKDQKVATGIDESGRLEVIEFHGDIRLRDGSYLRNWNIVIAGRKKVIRFERNPYFINPFVKWEFEPSEDGWSIPPLAYILGLVDASSILLSTGVEAAKNAINPPILAPESYFEQKKIYISEGMVIKYKPNQHTPNITPQPIQFNYQAPFPFLQLFESQSEATTGATRQLSGNITSNDKVQTATEFQGLQAVGNLILDRLVDLFNLDFKIPCIEKMAMINAMSNPEPRTIPIDNGNGVREFTDIQPDVYFGNYQYRVEDNKSEIERKQNIREKIQFFQLLSADSIVGPRIKKIELVKEYLRDFGYGQPGVYFMDDGEFVDFSLTQAAIQQEVQILAQQRLQNRLVQEGVMPNVPVQPGSDPGAGPVPGPPQGSEDPPGFGGVEGV